MPRKHWVEVDYPHSSTFYPHGSALQGVPECRPFQRYTCPAFQECFLGHQSDLSFFKHPPPPTAMTIVIAVCF